MRKLSAKQRGELNFWIDYIYGGGCERESGRSYVDQWRESSKQRFQFYFSNIKETVPHSDTVWADVGCGPYSILYEAPPAVTKILVDPLIKEYQRYRLLPGPPPPNSVFVEAPAEDLPLISACIDMVYCNNTLDHVEEPWDSMRELVRVLKVGGYLIIELDTGGVTDELHPHALQIIDIDRFLADLDMLKTYENLPTGLKRRPGARLYQAFYKRLDRSLRHFPDVWPPPRDVLRPTLVAEGIRGFNIVKIHDPEEGDIFYAIHQDEGPFFYSKVVAGEYRCVFSGPTVEEVTRKIEIAVP